MTEHHHALALAETLAEAARTGADAALGPIGRSLAVPALRELIDQTADLIDDLEGGLDSLGPTAAGILATAIRAKAATDAANAFVALHAAA